MSESDETKQEKKDRYNGITELGTKVLIFYGGIILFLIICSIPPMTIILPFAIPLVFIVCVIMNIGFIVKFIDVTKTELDNRMDIVHKKVFK